MAFVAAGRTLEKMRKNKMGWRIEELQAVAEENLVEWRRPGRGGSHVIFSAPGVREIVSVPAKRPIAGLYQAIRGADRRCRRYRNKVRATTNRNLDQYQFTVRPLSNEE